MTGVTLLCGLAGWCAAKAACRLLRNRRSRRAVISESSCTSEGQPTPQSTEQRSQATASTDYEALPRSPPPGAAPPAAQLQLGGIELVPKAALESEGLLGQGSFGWVLKCRLGERSYAVKVARGGGSGAALRQEALVTTRLLHPNIVPVHFLVEDAQGEPCGYAMPIAAGTLHTLLQDGTVARMGWPGRVRLCLDMARALACLHARGLVHCDLKPENLLAARVPLGAGRTGHRLLLADLGLAQALPPGMHAFAPRGTWAYWAPEQHQGLMSRTSECYSLALIMLEVLMGEPCKPEVDYIAQAKYKLVEEGWRPAIPDEVPLGVQLVLHNCLLSKPETRASAEKVVEELERMVFTPAHEDGVYPEEFIAELQESGFETLPEEPVELLS